LSSFQSSSSFIHVPPFFSSFPELFLLLSIFYHPSLLQGLSSFFLNPSGWMDGWMVGAMNRKILFHWVQFNC
jgi:hypothetical protein